ncbi:MAG: hypothetical protein J7L41_06925, partial [Synergistetes bacterium]|nr:hypothetical protein [Synergistota bacterium]
PEERNYEKMKSFISLAGVVKFLVIMVVNFLVDVNKDTWNLARPHFGIDMNGLTPFEKLKECNTMISNNIMKFPVLLLDHFLSIVSYPMEWLKKYLNLHILSKGGKYVYAQYP